MYEILLEDRCDYSLMTRAPVVVISDIDQTYLRTDFTSLSGLLVAALQFAVDKTAFPDMAAFYRALKRAHHWALYFVSSSPRQLAPIMERKLLIDMIPHDGIVLRDLADLVLTGRAGEIAKPFGYKLFSILSLIERFPRGATIVMVGDDTEADPVIYDTVVGLSRGTLGAVEVCELARAHGASGRSLEGLVARTHAIADKPFEVGGVFIRTTRGGKPRHAFELVHGDLVTWFSHPSDLFGVLRAGGLVDGGQHAAFVRYVAADHTKSSKE